MVQCRALAEHTAPGRRGQPLEYPRRAGSLEEDDMVAIERPEVRESERSEEPRLRSTRGPRYEAAELGFRHYWYPALLSRHLGKKPQAIKMLGEDLVFVRGEAGRPHALFDRCA